MPFPSNRTDTLPVAAQIEEERADLAKADRHIAEGDRRVREQLRRIERLEADSHDTWRSEEFLATLQATLVEWCAHREAILHRIAYLQSVSRVPAV